ncbi:MAG: hypothetical protein K9J06_15185 [Flavobacteriales bacterium]|nr:hypothetical protein [Flavobacteriales bacterium]
MESQKKSGSSIGGLIFVGCMFLGGGIGMAMGNMPVGGAVGMGVGFIAMGIIAAYNRNR